jgi:hypothetical protein
MLPAPGAWLARRFHGRAAIAAAGEHAILQLLGFPEPVHQPEAEDQDHKADDHGQEIDEIAPLSGFLLILARVAALAASLAHGAKMAVRRRAC